MRYKITAIKLITVICLLISGHLIQAQSNADYKNYRLLVGEHWCDADSSISLPELKSLDSLILQDKRDPAHKITINHCKWTVTYASRDKKAGTKTQSQYLYNSNAPVTKKWFKEINETKSGDVFLLEEIKTSGTKNSPFMFRLFLR